MASEVWYSVASMCEPPHGSRGTSLPRAPVNWARTIQPHPSGRILQVVIVHSIRPPPRISTCRSGPRFATPKLNLRAETADNFDVLIEHYLNPFGEIQVGYFYKRLTDPIVTTTTTVNNFQPTPAAPLGTYRVTQPINAGSAWVTGFEAAYIQHLSFLPGELRG